MTGKEQLSFLESKIGPYSSWTESSFIELVEKDDNSKQYFTAESTTEMLKKENEDLFSMIFCLNIGFRLNDSNQRVNKDFIQFKDSEKIYGCLENYLNSEELFDRFNAYQIIYSRVINTEKNEELLKSINLDRVIMDMNQLQAAIIKVDENEGGSFFLDLIQILYRLQEYVFENTGKNVLIETAAFSEKLNRISEVVSLLIAETLKHYPEKE